ncbi:MAG: hypothetical protein IKG99_02425 [Bacteroidaceae bacterium]|nr:hypothetical protein [Bacteroidaceae bacterium]
MKTTDPFEDLALEVTPKAILQGESTDAKKLGFQEALSVLKTIVSNDYDVLKMVRKYLREKNAQKDTGRIKEIINTFNAYSKTVLQEKLDAFKAGAGELSPLSVDMVKKFFKTNNAPAKLEDAVNAFVSILKD